MQGEDFYDYGVTIKEAFFMMRESWHAAKGKREKNRMPNMQTRTKPDKILRTLEKRENARRRNKMRMRMRRSIS